MHKKFKLMLVIITWIVILYMNGLLVNDSEHINQVIKDNPIEMMILFVLLLIISFFIYASVNIYNCW
ncbi:MAG: hypothetical protein ABF289_00290 [Clostridiales bacterium]